VELLGRGGGGEIVEGAELDEAEGSRHGGVGGTVKQTGDAGSGAQGFFEELLGRPLREGERDANSGETAGAEQADGLRGITDGGEEEMVSRGRDVAGLRGEEEEVARRSVE
jgi:hypothetical protein